MYTVQPRWNITKNALKIRNLSKKWGVHNSKFLLRKRHGLEPQVKKKKNYYKFTIRIITNIDIIFQTDILNYYLYATYKRVILFVDTIFERKKKEKKLQSNNGHFVLLHSANTIVKPTTRNRRLCQIRC